MSQSPCLVSPFRATIGVQPPYELVNVAGTELAVARRGVGQPVLCLHATAHGSRDFESLVEVLVPLGYEVVCLDWPSHGASPADATDEPVSARRYGTILSALVPVLFEGKRPIVIGNSIGGAAAMLAALDHPQAIGALVLCNPGGLARLHPLAKAVIQLLVRFFEAGVRGARWFPKGFELYYKLVLSGVPAHTQRARIVAAGSEMALILMQAWRSFGAADADLTGRVQKLQLPVLFAWAKADQIVAWSRSKRAVETVPSAKVEFFRGSHAAFLEDPAEFQRSFVAFVEGLPEIKSK